MNMSLQIVHQKGSVSATQTLPVELGGLGIIVILGSK